MSIQTLQATSVSIVWDDNSTLVFQFQSVTAGCPSLSSYAETVKSAVRQSRSVTVVYDDASYTPYTSANGQSYSLYQVFSLVG
jgi:hypothetical protein